MSSWSGEVFERLYRSNPDPWGFESSPYERAKYAETLAALEGRHFRAALELGCSIGVMSALLAPRCDRLLGVDIAETALGHARLRCAAHPHVAFRQAMLPAGFPAVEPASCDLIVVSELLYFLSPADNAALAHRVRQALAPDGMVVAVNWTGETDTPCTGDEAAPLFLDACGLPVTLAVRREGYRLDRAGFQDVPALAGGPS